MTASLSAEDTTRPALPDATLELAVCMLAASDGELAWKADTAIRELLEKAGWWEATANYFENEHKVAKAQLTVAISTRDEAVAREVTVTGWLKTAIEILSDTGEVDWSPTARAMARDLSALDAATSAHLTEHEALKANQRTPGCYEVCSACQTPLAQCKPDACKGLDRRNLFAPSTDVPCPLRKSP